MNIIEDEEGVLSTEKHRVCKVCKLDIDLIKETIGKYGMTWDKNSNMAKQWLKIMYFSFDSDRKLTTRITSMGISSTISIKAGINSMMRSRSSIKMLFGEGLTSASSTIR